MVGHKVHPVAFKKKKLKQKSRNFIFTPCFTWVNVVNFMSKSHNCWPCMTDRCIFKN